MSSWNQPSNNMMMGQAQFNPYITSPSYNYPTQMYRLPTYHADPIHGENAAWQFPMGPNSEIYLPDSDDDIIWWIRTDANGQRNVVGFDVTLHEKPKPIDTNDLEARLAAVEEWINAKSNKSNTKRSGGTATATVDQSVNGTINTTG